jgi:hypothetical protein
MVIVCQEKLEKIRASRPLNILLAQLQPLPVTPCLKVEVKEMSATIGDGMVTLALAGGIVGYFYTKHTSRQKRIEIIHQERMAAMEKGIPLPELPLETPRRPPDPTVLPILGIVLFTLSIGTMIVLRLISSAPDHDWVAPLPFAFLGVGLIAFHFLKGDPRR